jgi:serine/threonine protein kinase
MAIQRLLYLEASRLRFLTRTVARYTSDCHSDINQEEDSSTSYDATKYYPACIGELIHDKYRLISKLGWGGNSTVWLAKDTLR